MKSRHIATILTAAAIASVLLPAPAPAQQRRVRSIVDTIRANSHGNVNITLGDGVEKLAVADTAATPSSRHLPASEPSTTESTGSTHRQAVHRAGYRVQVYSDNNQRQAKAKAQNIAAKIGKQFPSYGLYLAYKAPYWRLRVGDFTTQEAARSAMSALRAKFPSLAGDMRVVRDRIKVYE